MSRTTKLAEALLLDRKQRRQSKPKSNRPRLDRERFDPFAITRWRVITGADPGYLPTTPMRMGPVCWFINCRHCLREFESKGWAYCPTCMALPAEERRREPMSGRRCCQVPGCGGLIPTRRRADAKYCEHHSAGRNGRKAVRQPSRQKYEATHEIPQQDQGAIFGPKTWPLKLIGGYRRADMLRSRPHS
jgi:hypothetical protein